MKSDVIEQLAQSDLLLPARIAEGLAANDSVKIRLSILQAAGCHAQNLGGETFKLTEECRAAGIEPAAMETLISRSALASDGRMTAPGLRDLGGAIWRDVTTMADAVRAADTVAGESALARLAAIEQTAPFGPDNDIALAQIGRLTSVTDHGSDSLHRLIMDLHKSLNAMAAEHAEGMISGAHIYGLLPEDRTVIEAFMRGLEF